MQPTAASRSRGSTVRRRAGAGPGAGGKTVPTRDADQPRGVGDRVLREEDRVERAVAQARAQRVGVERAVDPDQQRRSPCSVSRGPSGSGGSNSTEAMTRSEKPARPSGRRVVSRPIAFSDSARRAASWSDAGVLLLLRVVEEEAAAGDGAGVDPYADARRPQGPEVEVKRAGVSLGEAQAEPHAEPIHRPGDGAQPARERCRRAQLQARGRIRTGHGAGADLYALDAHDADLEMRGRRQLEAGARDEVQARAAGPRDRERSLDTHLAGRKHGLQEAVQRRRREDERGPGGGRSELQLELARADVDADRQLGTGLFQAGRAGVAEEHCRRAGRRRARSRSLPSADCARRERVAHAELTGAHDHAELLGQVGAGAQRERPAVGEGHRLGDPVRDERAT